jgi:hypothetical protein
LYTQVTFCLALPYYDVYKTIECRQITQTNDDHEVKTIYDNSWKNQEYVYKNIERRQITQTNDDHEVKHIYDNSWKNQEYDEQRYRI